MAFVIEENEKSVATVKMEIPSRDFEKGLQLAYQKQKNRFNVPGFRLGKAPRGMIEARFGKNVFYESALDEVFADVFNKNLEESDLKVVAQPKLVSVDSIGTDGAVLTLELALMPEFELCGYKAIPIGPLTYEPTQEDIDSEVESQLRKNARQVVVEDGPAEDGDTVSIDFDGYKDGEQFEGGKSENFALKLGSNTFIPGFESQIVGHKPGDEFSVDVVFPENYQSEELSGQPATFKVKLHDIKRTELPIADDDFAVDIGYENIEDMRGALTLSLKEKKEEMLRSSAKNYLMNYLAKNTPMDLAPKHVSDQAASVKSNYEQRILSSSGYKNIEDYYESMLSFSPNYNNSYFTNFYIQQADKQIRQDLIMQELIKQLDIKAEDEECEKKFEEYAKEYGVTLEEFKEKKLDEAVKPYVLSEIENDKVFEYLLSISDTETPQEPLDEITDSILSEEDESALSGEIQEVEEAQSESEE